MAPKPKATAKHLGRASTIVKVCTDSGLLIRNSFVWTELAPSVRASPEIVFAKCEVLAGTSATALKLKQVDPPGFENDVFEAPYDRVYNANDDAACDPATLRDIGLLECQNTAAVLHFLKKRFLKNILYTTADPLLVAVNPYKNVGLTDEKHIIMYRDAKSVGQLPPHVFSIARRAQDNLQGICKSQTIIVTGESGAGKTEATKHCMQFFASAKSGIDLRIQKAVMAANPVLEAFGNAKTLRNNNSSRFGRFMRLYIGGHGGIINGIVQGFLLEKVRVVSQSPNERSFHIFYQMLKGATVQEKSKFKLGKLESYKTLNKKSGGCYVADNIDDVEEFRNVREAFKSMQLSPDEVDTIFSIVSGVLMLGNVIFLSKNIAGQDNAAELDQKSKSSLADACDLLFLDDPGKVADYLCSTTKIIGKEEVTVRVQHGEAVSLTHSLCKAMYDNLFKWIIDRLNTTIRPADPQPLVFMGMLDIFGFEIFENNSLEQLLINITNEFLQKNFVDIVFERESKLYRDEGVSTAELVFTDNKDVIECLIGKRGSVFAVLEDTCLQKGLDNKFHSSMTAQMAKNPSFTVPTGGAKDLKFTIKHTIGEITYSAQEFVGKNMDILKADLAEVAQKSRNPIVRAMFGDIKVERGKLAKGQLIASKFVTQLDEMMSIIMTTEPHFIRCVKPNESKKPLDWVNDKVLNQLFSLSILEALQLKKLGFSWRRTYRDFIRLFKYLNLGIGAEMDKCPVGNTAKEKEIAMNMINHAKKILSAAKQQFEDGKQWQTGKTMVFLKPEIAQLLILKMREMMEEFTPCCALIEGMYTRVLLKRRAILRIPAAIRIQALIRRQLVKSNHHVSNTSPAPAVKV